MLAGAAQTWTVQAKHPECEANPCSAETFLFNTVCNSTKPVEAMGPKVRPFPYMNLPEHAGKNLCNQMSAQYSAEVCILHHLHTADKLLHCEFKNLCTTNSSFEVLKANSTNMRGCDNNCVCPQCVRASVNVAVASLVVGVLENTRTKPTADLVCPDRLRRKLKPADRSGSLKPSATLKDKKDPK